MTDIKSYTTIVAFVLKVIYYLKHWKISRIKKDPKIVKHKFLENFECVSVLFRKSNYLTLMYVFLFFVHARVSIYTLISECFILKICFNPVFCFSVHEDINVMVAQFYWPSGITQATYTLLCFPESATVVKCRNIRCLQLYFSNLSVTLEWIIRPFKSI